MSGWENWAVNTSLVTQYSQRSTSVTGPQFKPLRMVDFSPPNRGASIYLLPACSLSPGLYENPVSDVLDTAFLP